MKISEIYIPVVHVLEKSKCVDSYNTVSRSLKDFDYKELESQFYIFLKRREVATKHERDQNLEYQRPSG